MVEVSLDDGGSSGTRPSRTADATAVVLNAGIAEVPSNRKVRRTLPRTRKRRYQGNRPYVGPAFQRAERGIKGLKRPAEQNPLGRSQYPPPR